MLIPKLEGVDASKDFLELTTGGSGVLEGQSDLFGGIDNEDGSDGEGDTLLVDVGQVLLVEHVLYLTELISAILGERVENPRRT